MTVKDLSGRTVAEGIKTENPESGGLQDFGFTLPGGGSRGSRTPDPLLVRQTL